MSESTSSQESLPAGINNSYWFQATSSASWQMTMSSPLILFVRELGASSLVLGILSGIAPLTSMLQLPMSRRVERIGYRKLMLSGWSARTLVLFPLTALPLLIPRVVQPGLAISAALLIVLIFSILRGISVISWLPWMSALVPKPVRGAYLSRDRFFLSVAVVIGLVISGAFLVNHTSLAPYASVFAIGLVAAIASCIFLARVPDPSLITKTTRTTNTKIKQPQGAAVPWLSLLKITSFRKLVIYSMLIQVITIGSTSFITVFARERAGIPDGFVLWLTAGASLAGALALQLMRSRIDRMGSKPFMWVALAWWVVAFALWAVLSLNSGRGFVIVVAALLLVASGFFAAGHEMALTRLTMNIASAQRANAQYFAFYSVAASIAAGISPIVWGALLDALRNTTVMFSAFAANNYTIFFVLNIALLGLVAAALSRLSEGES